MALSDPDGILASPLTIINRTDAPIDMEAITGIISQHEVSQIIVGLPRSMDGSLGGQAEKVKAFIQKLCNQTEVPIEFRDERLTTVSTRRLMQGVNARKSGGKARHDDAIAAELIFRVIWMRNILARPLTIDRNTRGIVSYSVMSLLNI